MARNGRRTVLLSAHRWLDEGTAFGALFDQAIDVRSEQSERPSPRAEPMVSRAIQWIDENRSHPFFLHLHLMDVHAPRPFDRDSAALLDEGKRRPKAGWRWTERGTTTASPRELAWLDATYDGAVHRVDREIGRLVDHLEENGLLDDTLIVLTSDHGENLGEPGRRVGHDGPMRESVARVPLIIRYPRAVPAVRVRTLSSSVDVMPTILGITGVTLAPWKRMDGLDLTRAAARREERSVLSRHMIRSGRYKLLVDLPIAAVDAGVLRPEPIELVEIAQVGGKELERKLDDPELAARLFGEYRHRLREPFQRWVDARVNAQPEGGFALDARSFRLAAADGETHPGALAEAGWRTGVLGDSPLLRSLDGAAPLRISFPLPSGLYEMSMLGRGSFDLVQVEGGCDGEAARRRTFEGAGLRRLGIIEVCGSSFGVEVTPHEAGAFQLMGFEPVEQAARSAAASRERDRDLRALGYVH